MDTPRTPSSPITPVTPAHAIDRMDAGDPSLERGFVATLRWLVSEGDARGVRRIAIELRALREAIATLDETRFARDDYARRAAELDKELKAALAVLGPGTAVNGTPRLTDGGYSSRRAVTYACTDAVKRR